MIALVTSFSAANTPNLQISRHAQLIVNRAQEYIYAHFCEPLTIDDIAVAVGVSAVHLAQLFRKVTGSSLHRYVMDLRLSHALNRIDESSDFTALALDLGFSSHSHFTAAFRRRYDRYGHAPSSFREAEPNSSNGADRSTRHSAKLERRKPLCISRCAA